MSGKVIVGLVAVLALLDVFRLFGRSTNFSRLGLLMGAVARALIPLTAAIGIAAWQLIASFEGIAATGSGGLGVVARGSEQLVWSLLTGLIGFAAVLVLALILLARTRAAESGHAGLGGSRRRVAAAIGTMLVIASLGGAWVTLNWTDKIGVAIFAPMLGPGVIQPNGTPVPQPPAFYAGYVRMSGQQLAGESERLIPSRAFGLAACVVLIVLSFVTPVVFSGLRASGAVWNLACAGVVAVVGVAVWYSVHLRAAAGWLRMLIDR